MICYQCPFWNNGSAIRQLILDRYEMNTLESTYHDFDINPRLDDCFNAGYDKGYSKALYDISKMVGINLKLPEGYEED